MRTAALTKRFGDQAVAIDGKRTNDFDRSLSGFALRVTLNGAKPFVGKYRVGSGRSALIRLRHVWLAV